MPERSSKWKARRESITSSVDEPDSSSMRTENAPSISDKDFAELSEKNEKSVSKRIKETETGQREILKMIENLTSKIDSLTDRTPGNTNYGPNRVSAENEGLEPRPIELGEFCQDMSQHMVTGVSANQQDNNHQRSSSLPPPNQRYHDDIIDKLLQSLQTQPATTQASPGYQTPCLPLCQHSTEKQTS